MGLVVVAGRARAKRLRLLSQRSRSGEWIRRLPAETCGWLVAPGAVARVGRVGRVPERLLASRAARRQVRGHLLTRRAIDGAAITILFGGHAS